MALEAGGFRYIGHGIWECINCGHLMRNNDMLENDIDKCPKCSPQYNVGKVVEDIIEHDNTDISEWIGIQENRIKGLLGSNAADKNEKSKRDTTESEIVNE